MTVKGQALKKVQWNSCKDNNELGKIRDIKKWP